MKRGSLDGVEIVEGWTITPEQQRAMDEAPDHILWTGPEGHRGISGTGYMHGGPVDNRAAIRLHRDGRVTVCGYGAVDSMAEAVVAVDAGLAS